MVQQIFVKCSSLNFISARENKMSEENFFFTRWNSNKVYKIKINTSWKSQISSMFACRLKFCVILFSLERILKIAVLPAIFKKKCVYRKKFLFVVHQRERKQFEKFDIFVFKPNCCLLLKMKNTLHRLMSHLNPHMCAQSWSFVNNFAPKKIWSFDYCQFATSDMPHVGLQLQSYLIMIFLFSSKYVM
jgi:hypothetical protein